MTKAESVECKLWIMQRGRMQMTRQCERPYVKFGTETCGHFVGTPQNPVRKPDDVSDKCRRSRSKKAPANHLTHFSTQVNICVID